MTGGRDLKPVLSAVHERIDPTDAEREDLRAAVDELIARIEAELAEVDVDADVVHVGSTARDTWIRGDRDIDLFVRFPPALDRSMLARLGLDIGNEVLPEGHEEYAEHPYVTGQYDGYDVDLVPCYRVESARAIKSAVDRTPFHNAYLEEHIDTDTAGEIRLFKQFLKGIGVYGSDLRTEGYSGYLTELLILEYGSFEEVLDAAAGWHPPVEFDPEDHGARTFDDPLVVIDPTDPERNVAAVVAPENVARLVHYARSFLADPDESVFFPDPVEPLDAAEVREFVEERATTPIAVVFDPPDLVDDQLYPQLRRSLDGVVRGLEHRGFDVYRSAAWVEEKGVLYVELASASLPAVERHEGPPVHAREHAKRFLDTYADDPDVYGPFIDGERYVVERERTPCSAAEFLAVEIQSVALGAHIETVLEEECFSLLEGAEVADLVPEFGTHLAEYYHPKP